MVHGDVVPLTIDGFPYPRHLERQLNQRSRSVARHQNTTFQIRVSQNISGASQNESALQHSPKQLRKTGTCFKTEHIYTLFFKTQNCRSSWQANNISMHSIWSGCTSSAVQGGCRFCLSLSIWDLGVSADFGYAEQAVRSNFTITLNLLLSFKRSPEFLQLFRRKLQRCFCGEAPEMFGGLRNSPSLSEHQRDPSSFSSSLTNRVLIHCCQMTFKNHVGIISVITQNKRWCLRCSIFTDTCNNFTFRSKMLNSIKAVWLRSWGFIARLNLWPFTLSQCIRKASHRVLFLRFPICESLLISAMVLWDSTARDTPVMLLQIDFSFLLSFQSDSVKYKLPA